MNKSLNNERGHFKKICKYCKVIIVQCRCADPNKEVIYGICQKCASKRLLKGNSK